MLVGRGAHLCRGAHRYDGRDPHLRPGAHLYMGRELHLCRCARPGRGWETLPCQGEHSYRNTPQRRGWSESQPRSCRRVLPWGCAQRGHRRAAARIVRREARRLAAQSARALRDHVLRAWEPRKREARDEGFPNWESPDRSGRERIPLEHGARDQSPREARLRGATRARGDRRPGISDFGGAWSGGWAGATSSMRPPLRAHCIIVPFIPGYHPSPGSECPAGPERALRRL